jgi:hypothetical protein
VKSFAQLVNLIGAADATRGRGDVLSWSAHRSAAVRLDGDHVEASVDGRPGRAVADGLDGRVAEPSVGEAKANCKLEVVPGCTHRGGDRRTVQSNLQGLLDG